MATQLERLQSLKEGGSLSDDQITRLDALIALQSDIAAPVETEQPPIPPTPEPIIPPREDERPTTLPELTGGFVTRPAFELAGGLAGGAAGVTGGPFAPAAVLAGGGLGAAGGSAFFDTVTDALRSIGVLKVPKEAKRGLERSKEVGLRALQAGAEDVAFGAGGQVILTAAKAGKPALGKILGVRSKDARAITEQAKRNKLAVGAVEVGGPIAKGIERVIGIFPFVSSPIRKARGKVIVSVENRMKELLNTFAPNATMTSELSINMFNASKNARKEFLRTSGRLYDNFRELAKDSGDIIPTDNLKELGRVAREAEEAGTIFLKGEKKLAAPTQDVVNDFVKQLEGLPDNINVEQFTKLSRDLEKAFKKFVVEGVDVRALAGVKGALEDALSNINVMASPDGLIIKDALDTANRFYAKNIARFQTPTAKKFGRVDKKVFEAGRGAPGTINADEVFEVAVNARSAVAIKDLEKLVGEKLIRQAGRKIVEHAISKNTLIKGGIPQLPKFGDIRKTLGLIGPEGRIRNEALAEMIGKKNLKALDDTLAIASKIAETQAVSNFIARRATLGGAAAIGTAFTFGGSVLKSGGAIGSLGLTLLARHLGRLATDPAALEQLQRVILNTDVALSVRRTSLLRLARTIAQDSSERAHLPDEDEQ